MIAISGNTYPVKDELKALGGRWDADAKAWMVPDAKAAAARALVADRGQRASARPNGERRTRTKSMQTRRDGQLVWVRVRQIYERGVGWVDARDHEED